MISKVTRREFVRDSAVAAVGVAAGLGATYTVHAGNPAQSDTSQIMNYNPEMEYRRCGRTNWMISAVCLGGHWKRLDTVIPGLFQGGDWLGANLNSKDFEKNRYDVVTRCIERGINYIDACTAQEVIMYAKALKGRRDKMHLGYSWYQNEVRSEAWRTVEKLKQSFNNGLKEAGLEYVDLWRITMHEQSGQHTEPEVEATMKALEWAKKEGRARFTGISSHDRPHIKMMIEKYTGALDVIVTPYTAKTKVVDDKDGLWAAMKKMDVGWFGIKPYAGGSLFNFKDEIIEADVEVEAKGKTEKMRVRVKLLGDQQKQRELENDRLARLAIRYILCNPAITAPIPGMIRVEQVDNVATAVKEHRELDEAERAQLDRAMDRAWANLPYHYRWLKDWEYV